MVSNRLDVRKGMWPQQFSQLRSKNDGESFTERKSPNHSMGIQFLKSNQSDRIE